MIHSNRTGTSNATLIIAFQRYFPLFFSPVRHILFTLFAPFRCCAFAFQFHFTKQCRDIAFGQLCLGLESYAFDCENTNDCENTTKCETSQLCVLEKPDKKTPYVISRNTISEISLEDRTNLWLLWVFGVFETQNALKTIVRTPWNHTTVLQS